MGHTTQETKHVACARCRERKVKCDGGKPGCRRCSRNRVECQYVRGRKQQGKSEWVQHLRTFSSQPGKTSAPLSTTLTLPEPQARQPSLPQPSRSIYDVPSSASTPYFTRSPSPYVTECAGTPLSTSYSSLSSLNTSSSSYGSLDESTPSPLPPCTPEASVLFPQMFIFDPSEAFNRSNFASDCLAPSNAQAYLSTGQNLWKAHTPTSQASEVNGSSLGEFPVLSDPSYGPLNFFSSGATGMDWNTTPFSSAYQHSSMYNYSSC
ncbi:hypothetical protein K458DRAFT_470317 [Lentithecium fluviatile CBS 122367]|uniref:Zn(2)-C6 fungal-type domain-containing protein n=1 Tax=Lentithecium fluviatile CBS 122367 TaxID=1168545 RepID=A0A6G1J8L2_9PLEO|nr:hypothetical protein K458DRAFT_470317 [Lentithecium fluviatile CBS 122367]